MQAFLDAVQDTLHTETVAVHQVPLVHHHDEAAIGVPGQAGDVGVLGGGEFRGVGYQEGNVAATHGVDRAQHAVAFDAALHLSRPPNPGRIDQGDVVVAVSNLGVQRVAGGSRHRADDAAFLADDGVGQQRLADVGSPDDGETHFSGGNVLRLCVRFGAVRTLVIIPTFNGFGRNVVFVIPQVNQFGRGQ